MKMTNTVNAKMLTLFEAVRICGGHTEYYGCCHPKAYKTGNYEKTLIGFFYWVSEEYYCPGCGETHWEKTIEF